MTERYRYDSALEKVYDDETFNGESTENYGVFECCEIMNEQYEYIERLKRNFKALDKVKCELAEENEQLKSDLDYFKAKNGSLETKMFNLERENKKLNSENNMLKVTIGRNEAYIKRLTETSEWHC